MSSAWRNLAGLALPLFAAFVGWRLWRERGFDGLNQWELPLAVWMNHLTGRVDSFDYLVIFLNRTPGEALCVLIIFGAYAFVASRLVPKPVDWRRVGMFAGLIFVTWFGANSAGDRLEPVFQRPSPSNFMGKLHVNLQERHGRKVKVASQTSFPSNHGGVFFTVFFMCLLRWRDSIRPAWPLWAGLFVLATLLSMPRVFTGAHWMSDTLIGSAILTWVTAALVMHTPVWAVYQRMENFVVCASDRFLESREAASG